MKKADLTKEICKMVGVKRLNPELGYLTFDEMLHVHSWINITYDLQSEVRRIMEKGTWKRGMR